MSVCRRHVAAVTIVIGIAIAAPVIIKAVTPLWHDAETAAKTSVIESSLETEFAVPPGKMRTCNTAKSAAYFGATEMAATEMAATKTGPVTTPATKTGPVTTPATKTAPVTTATSTAPMRKRVDSQSAGESGSRSQDDHGLA
jgi:hypothetical protein